MVQDSIIFLKYKIQSNVTILFQKSYSKNLFFICRTVETHSPCGQEEGGGGSVILLMKQKLLSLLLPLSPEETEIEAEEEEEDESGKGNGMGREDEGLSSTLSTSNAVCVMVPPPLSWIHARTHTVAHFQ